jgi:hypothetical protein
MDSFAVQTLRIWSVTARIENRSLTLHIVLHDMLYCTPIVDPSDFFRASLRRLSIEKRHIFSKVRTKEGKISTSQVDLSTQVFWIS